MRQMAKTMMNTLKDPHAAKCMEGEDTSPRSSGEEPDDALQKSMERLKGLYGS
jgi:hypothetical protein